MVLGAEVVLRWRWQPASEEREENEGRDGGAAKGAVRTGGQSELPLRIEDRVADERPTSARFAQGTSALRAALDASRERGREVEVEIQPKRSLDGHPEHGCEIGLGYGHGEDGIDDGGAGDGGAGV